MRLLGQKEEVPILISRFEKKEEKGRNGSFVTCWNRPMNEGSDRIQRENKSFVYSFIFVFPDFLLGRTPFVDICFTRNEDVDSIFLFRFQ